MNAQKHTEIIKKMLHPNITVPSLMMFSKKLQKESLEALLILLEKSCEIDVFKTATVAQHLQGENASVAQERVLQILTDRCQDAENFTHLDLLAIAVYNNPQLLKDTSVYFTKQIVTDAFDLADVHIACWLLRMSLTYLSQEPCELVEKAFCKFLVTTNTTMDDELSQLVPILIEYDAVKALSTLIELAGVEQVEKFYGKPLFPEVDRMIRISKDSLSFWEIFLENFFALPHTLEELCEDGLWHIQLYASESVYNEVCAIFYLYVATHYGIEHPLFEYVEGFETPKEYSRKHIIRYKDTIDSLWEKPEFLSNFLNKTKLCNPFLTERNRLDGYELLENAEDPVSYSKLAHLFEIKASPSAILNIFLSTDLRTSLPIEDVFYLAQRYEVLTDLLEVVKGIQFFGVVTNSTESSIFLLPISYGVTILHIMKLSFKANKILNSTSRKKGKTLPYTIEGFYDGHIRIAYYENFVEESADTESLISWEAAIEEFKEILCLPQISFDQLQQLNILQFKRDALLNECDFNLFTRLFLEYPNQIYTFLKILDLSNWNFGYSNKNWRIKKELYDDLKPYYEDTLRLFKVLFDTQKSSSVLEVYFSSIYKAILPLNELLFIADKEILLESLPRFSFTCQLKEQDSNLCRPKNILCAPICSVENTESIVATKPFDAFVSDFTIMPTGVYRIILSPRNTNEVSVEERGSTFGFLSKNIHIGEWRTELISQFPSTDNYDYREIRFNIVCMEDAILLRRSDSDALMQLIQILGNANPFAFQVSTVADQIYLKRFCSQQDKKDTKLSAITTMLLNAKGINCVRELYLNTYIKFYMSLSHFAQLIRERRTDLLDQIPNLFEGIVFYAIADDEGNLWMPWVEQNTIQVAKEYAGQFLHCTISIDTDGTISVNVLDAHQSDNFFELLEICKLAGYQTTPYMEALHSEFLRLHAQNKPKIATTKKVSSLNKSLSFEQSLEFLKKQLYSKPFVSKEFAKNIGTLIRNYCHSVSAREMENAIEELTAEWIQRYPHTKEIRKYWYGTHLCFAGYYHSFGLGSILVGQFHEYLYGNAAISFEEKINNSIIKLTNDFENTPSFEQALSQIKELLQKDNFEYSSFTKQIRELIKNYKAIVTIEKMTNGIAKLTAEFIQLYPYEDDIKRLLFSIHQNFYSTYKSGSLGLILCEQFHQYLEGPQAHSFELSVRKTLSLPTDVSTLPQNNTLPEKSNKTSSTIPPIPLISTLPFETNVEKIRQMLYDTEFDAKSFIKYLRKLIQKYNESVSEKDMLESITKLLEQLLQQHPYNTINKTFLIGIHTCFASFYQSNKLGLALCELAHQYLDQQQANDFVHSFKRLELKKATH